MEVEGTIEEQNPTVNGIKTKADKKEKEKEGSFLLGPPTFADLGNGRFKCEETGHELPAKERESYARSKACRLALIDAAVAKKKPPLNTFQQCPLSKSKLVCQLTGDTINKSEEHIWKHITGKRFQNKLEQKEMEKLASPKKEQKSKKKSIKLQKSSTSAMEDDEKIKAEEDASLEGHPVENISDSEEPEFWIPPVGERWDYDDGKDRWESQSGSEHECEENNLDEANEQQEIESAELSMRRTKRMSIAVGPSSFASRKKKSKRTSPTDSKHCSDNV